MLYCSLRYTTVIWDFNFILSYPNSLRTWLTTLCCCNMAISTFNLLIVYKINYLHVGPLKTTCCLDYQRRNSHHVIDNSDLVLTLASSLNNLHETQGQEFPAWMINSICNNRRFFKWSYPNFSPLKLVEKLMH